MSSGTIQNIERAVTAIKMPIDANSIVEVHNYATGENVYALVSTLISQMQETDESYELCALYCSLLKCFLPSLSDVIPTIFSELGMNVQYLNNNQEREASGIVMLLPMPPPIALVHFGQMVLLLYKNVQATSYVNFMSRRIEALKGYAGAGTGVVSLTLPIKKAETVSKIMGGSFVLRRFVLVTLIHTARSESQIAQLSSYLTSILEHTGMAAFSFIYETLILTRSPVLKLPSLRREVLNLAAAERAINATDHPKFFKILNPPYMTKVIERSRFPTIAALATLIKSDATATAQQFVDNRVRALKAIHDQYMARRGFAS